MSNPCQEELRADTISLINDEWIKEYGREPSEDEIEMELEDYYEIYRE